ncbi:MAG: type I-E CRISPR-associated protein Cse2/CasB [Desulfobacula sp.]
MEDLMEFLRKKKEDRGAMAVLRRGLISGQAQRTWPILAPFNGIGIKFHERAVQVIAGLYAMHPKETSKGNFGFSCRGLLNDDERSKISRGEEGPLSKRFHHLLAADGDEVFDRVIHFVQRIKHQQDIPVNYNQLSKDLLSWQNPYRKDRVRTEWAKSFWSAPDEDKEVEK